MHGLLRSLILATCGKSQAGTAEAGGRKIEIGGSLQYEGEGQGRGTGHESMLILLMWGRTTQAEPADPTPRCPGVLCSCGLRTSQSGKSRVIRRVSELT